VLKKRVIMNKHKILIVDDEPNILSSLKKILEGEDKEVLTAKTAEDGWNVLKENRDTEIVISDNKLPGMLGIDFLIKVKHLYPDTIRILITGYPDLNSAMDAINKAHIWRYILKPIEVEELRTLIAQAFDYHRILKENRLLLKIARQQQKWIKAFKEKHPQVVSEDIAESTEYAAEEKKVSDIISEFMKKYYPDENEEG
jgi:DNA-binding NtrC family response regulator